MTEPVYQYYHLVCGELVFRKTNSEVVNSMRINCVLINNNEDGLTVRHLALAQQTLQANFHRRMDDTTLEVLDVVIMNIMPLGYFTEESFNAAPPGTVVREMTKDDPDPFAA